MSAAGERAAPQGSANFGRCGAEGAAVWENHGKKSDGKTMGIWWFNDGLMGFLGIYSW